MAPEQVEGHEVGPPADVYALGLVLLECLTGRRAFEGPAQEAAFARLTRDPGIPDTVPPRWRGLITALTARDPADRPPAADLDRTPAPAPPANAPIADATIPLNAPVAPTGVLPVAAAAGIAGVAGADGRPTPGEGGRRKGGRREGGRRRWAVVAILGLIGAAVAWGLLLRSSDGSDPIAAVVTSSTSTFPTTVPTTVPVTAPPTTTTTLPPCETVDALLDLLDEQKKDLGPLFKGDKDGKEQAKAELEAQQDAAKAQQDACKDAEDDG